MSLCYNGALEKVALDALDQRTINWFQRLAGFGRSTGKGLAYAGRALGTLGRGAMRSVEWVGDQVVNHPTRTALWAVPATYGLSKLPERLDKSINNLHSENVYQY